MTAILSYGAYVPFYRLARATISAALGVDAGKGARAVASYDEDTVTMAVEAARACMAAAGAAVPDVVSFATTDPPYLEKLNAATVHAALDLPSEARAVDLACSLRCGLAGLLQAADAAASGRTSLVTMSDIRIGAPEGPAERGGGDGAAAFLVGPGKGIARIVETYSETHEYLAQWRAPGQRFARAWEERFALTQAYQPLMQRAAATLLERAGVGVERIKAAVLDAPNPRAAGPVAKAIGLRPEQMVDSLLTEIGHTGTAHAGLMLASALDRAEPGDLLLVVSVSDGVDGLLLEVTEGRKTFEPRRTVAALVASKRDDLPYTRYLKWRGLLETEPPRRPDPDRPAAPPSLRSERWKFAFVGSQCSACGTYHLPPQIVCVACRASGRMKPAPFADRRASIRTFTIDRLAYTPQPPMVVAVIDFEGGGRFESELTDCEPEKVEIGQQVEMTFRRLYTAQGVHNYFWKARPIR
ncbi:MAG: hydroxymethylglutaryl-CoA synthase family protein [Candidatus Dadabacteria bacterium]|nr:MAG: hydroxymethylglutaryl-CoA synthase family protein [Candidatus Dadabacteria bacterium]